MVASKRMEVMEMLMVVSGLILFSALAGASAGMPNPASVACKNKGGHTVIYRAPEGEIGMCALERALIEEWTLRKAATDGATTQATQAFLQHKPWISPSPSPAAGRPAMPNPASVYCKQMHGESKILTSDAGETGICKFADRSMIEEWTLFRGPTAGGYALLASLLGFKSGS